MSTTQVFLRGIILVPNEGYAYDDIHEQLKDINNSNIGFGIVILYHYYDNYELDDVSFYIYKKLWMVDGIYELTPEDIISLTDLLQDKTKIRSSVLTRIEALLA